jgi:DNA-binding CsgD family transcriptional regulator
MKERSSAVTLYLGRLSQGKTNAVIAVEIGLSRRTVEAHRLRMMRQAGVANTAELIAWFIAS